MYFLSYSKTIRPPWKSNELRGTTYWFKECVKLEAIFSWWVCRKSPPLDGGVTKATATNLAGQATIVASLLLLWRRWSIRYDALGKPKGMDVCITTTAKTDKEGQRLLALMGMPFREGGGPSNLIRKKKLKAHHFDSKSKGKSRR